MAVNPPEDVPEAGTTNPDRKLGWRTAPNPLRRGEEWLSRINYAIPFGIFSTSKEYTSDEPDVMVGREQQRATLINGLIKAGNHGAFLVTGRRGMGKSEFVRHCVEEYQKATHRRYLQSNTGKTFFDPLRIHLFTIAVLLLSHASINLLWQFYYNGDYSLISMVFMVLPFLICIIPIIYAKAIVSRLIDAWGLLKNKEGSVVESLPNTVRAISILFIITAIGLFLNIISQKLGIVNIFVYVILLSSVFVYCLAVLNNNKEKDRKVVTSNQTIMDLFSVTPIILLSGVVFFKGDVLWRELVGLTGFEEEGAFLQSPRVSAVLFYFSLALYWSSIIMSADRYIFRGIRLNLSSHKVRNAAYFVFVLSCIIALPMGAIYGIGNMGARHAHRIAELALFPMVLGFALLHRPVILYREYIHLSNDNKNETPKISSGEILSPFWNIFLYGSPLILSVFILCSIFIHGFGILILDIFHPSDAKNMSKLIISAIKQMDIDWVIVYFFLFSALYFAEYTWIMRPYAYARGDRAIAPEGPHDWRWRGKRKDPGHPDPSNQYWDDIRKPNRRRVLNMIADLTFSNKILNSWQQSLVITINLSFDDIDHRSVIQAMLVGLRDQYHRYYVSWASPLANLSRLFLMVVTIIGVAIAGNYLFDYRNNAFRVGKLTNKQKDEFDTVRESLHEELKNMPHVAFGFHDKLGSLSEGKLLDIIPLQSGKAYGGLSDDGEPNYDLNYLFTPKAKVDESFSVADKSSRVFERRYGVSSTFCGNAKRLGVFIIRRSLEEKKHSSGGAAQNPLLPKIGDIYQVPRIAWIYCHLFSSDILISLLYAKVLEIKPEAELLYGRPASGPRSDKSIQSAASRDVHAWTDERFPFHNLVHLNDEILGPDATTSPSISLRVYHLVLFGLFILFVKLMSRLLGFNQYQAHLLLMDQLISALTSRTSESDTQVTGFWGQMAFGLFGRNKLRTTVRDPSNHQVVQHEFLSVLNKLQTGEVGLLSAFGIRLSASRPEITFVFDELDKISGKVSPDEEMLPDHIYDASSLEAERHRSIAIHRLLSDLKMIISSAPARFIFVGGRPLHDEWLADQTTRQPLLSSIFDQQIYLPSLIADRPGEADQYIKSRWGKAEKEKSLRVFRNWQMSMGARVEEYLYRQFERSEYLFGRMIPRRMLPAAFLPWEGFREARFSNLPYDPNQERGALGKLKVIETLEGSRLRFAIPAEQKERTPVSTNGGAGANREHEDIESGAAQSDWEESFLEAFVDFLTYRSMGTPKKLNELLTSFARPAGHVIPDWDDVRWRANLQESDDILWFDDKKIYEVQVLHRLFRVLCREFESYAFDRDDKVMTSVLYITDFLLKFHSRAFSWSSLERIDELAHIHRAPDLRDMLESVVQRFEGVYLHRVLNGLYAYRFRSDFSKEIDFLSGHSNVEMASFNFTLDESQHLKTAYRLRLKANDEKSIDLIEGLAELYEYDQEFDDARYYYRMAVNLADAGLTEVLKPAFNPAMEAEPAGNSPGSGVLEHVQSVIHAIFAGDTRGYEILRAFLPWGVVRLRLMLQIGMTFERQHNLERAEVEYAQARQLSYAMLRAYLTLYQRPESIPQSGWSAGEDVGQGPDFEDISTYMRPSGSEPGGNDVPNLPRRHRFTIGHMNILYQANFARAWAVQKHDGAIDTSVAIVEEDLNVLRRILPFVNESASVPVKATSSVGLRLSNFAVVASELHNKAGDFYFYRGRQAMPVERFDEKTNKFRALGKRDVCFKNVRWTDGHLPRAYYHYCVSLHEIRRLNTYRLASSANKLDLTGSPAITFSDTQWPQFVYLSTANNLANLAETVLSRVSIIGLMEEMSGNFAKKSLVTASWRLDGWSECFYQNPNLERWFSNADGAFESGKRQLDGPLALVLDEAGKDSKWIDLGQLSNWMGEWNDTRKVGPDRDIKLLTFQGPDAFIPRLVMALNLSMGAARMAKLSANYPVACRELLLVVDAVSHVFWWMHVTDFVAKCDEDAQTDILDDELRESIRGAHGEASGPRMSPFILWLVEIAVNALEEIDRLYRVARADPDGGYILVDTIPIGNFTAICSLFFSVEMLFAKVKVKLVDDLKNDDPDNKSKKKYIWNEERDAKGPKKYWCASDEGGGGFRSRILAIIHQWTGQEIDTSPRDLCLAQVKNLLRQTIERHRYPVQNRLHALRLLAGVDVISFHHLMRAVEDYFGEFRYDPESKEKLKKQLLAADICRNRLDRVEVRNSEMLHLADRARMPMHFTPLRSGLSCGLSALLLARIKSADVFSGALGDDFDLSPRFNKLKTRAMNDLSDSREMYTLGQAFYNNLNQLYYLYDDFNDRQLHFHHSMQMFGSDVAVMMERVLRRIGNDGKWKANV